MPARKGKAAGKAETEVENVEEAGEPPVKKTKASVKKTEKPAGKKAEKKPKGKAKKEEEVGGLFFCTFTGGFFVKVISTGRPRGRRVQRRGPPS